MTVFTLSTGYSGKDRPQKFGPFARRDPDALAGWRPTPEGVAWVEYFLARYDPVVKLAVHLRMTRKLALRCQQEYGTDELAGLCHVAVVEAVRRWRPWEARLSTVVGWEMYAQLTRFYRYRERQPAAARVFTNCFTRNDASGNWLADLDLVPARPDRGDPTAEAADQLAALARRAADVGLGLTPREADFAARHYGRGETLAAIAASAGLTKERVRQIAMRAVEKLRAAAGVSPPARRAVKREYLAPTGVPCRNCGAAAGRWCSPAGTKTRTICGVRKMDLRRPAAAAQPLSGSDR